MFFIWKRNPGSPLNTNLCQGLQKANGRVQLIQKQDDFLRREKLTDLLGQTIHSGERSYYMEGNTEKFIINKSLVPPHVLRRKGFQMFIGLIKVCKFLPPTPRAHQRFMMSCLRIHCNSLQTKYIKLLHLCPKPLKWKLQEFQNIKSVSWWARDKMSL